MSYAIKVGSHWNKGKTRAEVRAIEVRPEGMFVIWGKPCNDTSFELPMSEFVDSFSKEKVEQAPEVE